jgi:hypothetical protein
LYATFHVFTKKYGSLFGAIGFADTRRSGAGYALQAYAGAFF